MNQTTLEALDALIAQVIANRPDAELAKRTLELVTCGCPVKWADEGGAICYLAREDSATSEYVRVIPQKSIELVSLPVDADGEEVLWKYPISTRADCVGITGDGSVCVGAMTITRDGRIIPGRTTVRNRWIRNLDLGLACTADGRSRTAFTVAASQLITEIKRGLYDTHEQRLQRLSAARVLIAE